MPGFLRLEGGHERRAPFFEPPALPCPTSTLRAFVKQVRPSALSAQERGFLNAAFAGFLTGARPPGHVNALLAALSPHTFHEDRLPRRYDGDATLPRGRYSTLCQNGDGDDGGTLQRELLFYKDARVAEAHIEIYDPAVARHRETIGWLGMDDARDRLVVRLVPFVQPANAAAPWSVVLSVPVEIRIAHVEHVLDLRRPEALEWLFRTIPTLHCRLDDIERQPCFPSRHEPATVAELLPSLVDQQRGGGNFDKLVGLYLRLLGVSGLVFPSARSDAHTHVVDGALEGFHGWSFVDYRDAPPPEIAAFVELRPEWPRTLTLEGGDDNVPRPAAFADEFQIVLTEGFPSPNGGFAFRGIESRIEAYHMMDSLEAAVHFRLPGLDNEQALQLKTFAVSLGARQCTNFCAMALWSLLGLARAREDLKGVLREQLREHPLAGLLAQCADPPPAEAAELSRSGAFRALFQASPPA
jgi:hypothetical protein